MKMPAQSSLGSYARSLCHLYFCSQPQSRVHLAVVVLLKNIRIFIDYKKNCMSAERCTDELLSLRVNLIYFWSLFSSVLHALSLVQLGKEKCLIVARTQYPIPASYTCPIKRKERVPKNGKVDRRRCTQVIDSKFRDYEQNQHETQTSHRERE